MITIESVQGDITRIKVDAIVNAAAESLMGGGGVDGAIHNAAGPQLYEECLTLNGCKTGQAKITKGYKLPAKYVIHTVGPIWHQYTPEESRSLLFSCYTESLRLADENKVSTIAFPAISTGVFGFPADDAAKVAIDAINEYATANKDSHIQKVMLVSFSTENKTFIDNELQAAKL